MYTICNRRFYCIALILWWTWLHGASPWSSKLELQTAEGKRKPQTRKGSSFSGFSPHPHLVTLIQKPQDQHSYYYFYNNNSISGASTKLQKQANCNCWPLIVILVLSAIEVPGLDTATLASGTRQSTWAFAIDASRDLLLSATELYRNVTSSNAKPTCLRPGALAREARLVILPHLRSFHLRFVEDWHSDPDRQTCHGHADCHQRVLVELQCAHCHASSSWDPYPARARFQCILDRLLYGLEPRRAQIKRPTGSRGVRCGCRCAGAAAGAGGGEGGRHSWRLSSSGDGDAGHRHGKPRGRGFLPHGERGAYPLPAALGWPCGRVCHVSWLGCTLEGARYWGPGLIPSPESGHGDGVV